jgi:hypothetical protein
MRWKGMEQAFGLAAGISIIEAAPELRVRRSKDGSLLPSRIERFL